MMNRFRYCETCGKERLDPENKKQMDFAIIQALAQMCGARISPTPSYCECLANPHPIPTIEELKYAD